MVVGGPPANATPPIVNCPLCSGQHRLSKCEFMKAKSPEERKSFVRQVRLCDNCFAGGHVAMDCRSKMKRRRLGRASQNVDVCCEAP